MPFTTIAFDENQDSATLVNIAALADQHIRVSGDDITVPALNEIVGLYAVGPSITQVRIDSPSLRILGNIDLEPVDLAAEPVAPPAFHDLRASPRSLDVSESLNALGSEGGATTRITVGVWLADRAIQRHVGQFFTVRCTNASTLAANAWTNGELTFSQGLPAGRYRVVGMRAQSAGLQLARLVFIGGAWRPGCIGHDADGDIEEPSFRYGRFGIWGEFEHDTPPSVDFLSNSADTAQVVHLDLEKVG